MSDTVSATGHWLSAENEALVALLRKVAILDEHGAQLTEQQLRDHIRIIADAAKRHPGVSR